MTKLIYLFHVPSVILRKGILVHKGLKPNPAAFVIGIPVYFWCLPEIGFLFVVETDSSGILEELLKNSLRITKPSQFFEISFNIFCLLDGFVF